MVAGGDEAKRAFDPTMTTKKIDVAAIEAARRERREGRFQDRGSGRNRPTKGIAE